MTKLFVAGIICAAGAMAQDKVVLDKIERDMVVQRVGPAAGNVAFSTEVAGPGVQFFRSSPAPVKGAPYSAEAVTERVQVLADGNRITEKNTSKQYRDSEGRTRVENAIGPMMAFVPANGKMSLVFIDDPVAGVHYTLHPDNKTAEKMSMPNFDWTPASKVVSGVAHKEMTVTAVAGEASVGGPTVMVYSPRSADAPAHQRSANKTSLGKRIIEGVEADGTKVVETIPAGAMGNERALEITTEVWYSNELKTDVLRKHSDPRFGETTYKLTSVIRGEQPLTLFEPPADFKLTESLMRMKLDRKP